MMLALVLPVPGLYADMIVHCDPSPICSFTQVPLPSPRPLRAVQCLASPSTFFTLDNGFGVFNATIIQIVTNGTTAIWNEFRILRGHDETFPGRSHDASTDGLVFTPAPTISGPGTTAAVLSTATVHLFDWTNLNVAPGQTITITFQTYDSIGLVPGGGTRGLTQQVAIGVVTPEPTSSLLAGLAFDDSRCNPLAPPPSL